MAEPDSRPKGGLTAAAANLQPGIHAQQQRLHARLTPVCRAAGQPDSHAQQRLLRTAHASVCCAQPDNVEAQKIKAKTENGVLHIEVRAHSAVSARARASMPWWRGPPAWQAS